MFALIDANNFYASVERNFDPRLNGRAVIVIGNNDGCCIARSQEARALGIKMGEPIFKVRARLPDADIVVRSANFALYGLMSHRMMAIASTLGPTQEVYSIDEAFQGQNNVPGDLVANARQMRARILQWIGLPTGIGIGSTKTRAKLANHIAKSAERRPGSYPAELAQVCNLEAMPASDSDAMLAATDLQEVWGIGRRLGAQLRERGLATALDVANMDPPTSRRLFGLTFERTVRELGGQSCIPIEEAPPAKQQIACTRSFGNVVRTRQSLCEALSEFTSRAAEKLRGQGMVAAQIQVFAQSNPFAPADMETPYARSITVPLPRPTADTRRLIWAALMGLDAIFLPGIAYKRAGVMLMDLRPVDAFEQSELALADAVPSKQTDIKLMVAMDAINSRFGRGSLKLASAGLSSSGGGDRRDSRLWTMKQDHRSPDYMSRWDQVPVAMA